MVKRIEDIFNWCFDRDSAWWFLGRLRPRRDEQFSFGRVCLFRAIDIAAGLSLLFFSFMAMTTLNPLLSALVLSLLSEDIGEQPFTAIAVSFIVIVLLVRTLMAVSWNRRARRELVGFGGKELI